jgi:hypothetical protein
MIKLNDFYTKNILSKKIYHYHYNIGLENDKGNCDPFSKCI